MKKEFIVMAVLAAVLMVGSAAQATISYYTDRTAFEAALVQMATFGVGDYLDWDAESTGSLSDPATGFGLDAGTDDMFYDSVWYELEEGVEFITTEGTPASIMMVLSEGINAIGGYFGSDDAWAGGPVTVTLTTTLSESSEVLVDYDQGLASGTPAFNGWIVTGSELAYLQIDSGSSVAPAFGKDLILGSTVPEPATLCLLGLGGLMLRRRKKA